MGDWKHAESEGLEDQVTMMMILMEDQVKVGSSMVMMIMTMIITIVVVVRMITRILLIIPILININSIQ